MHRLRLPLRHAVRFIAGLAAAVVVLSAAEPVASDERALIGQGGEASRPVFAVPLEFRGVMMVGSVVSVALAVSPEAPARWVPVGGRLGDYTVVAVDANRETMLVAAPGAEFRLGLKAPHVAPRGDNLPESLSAAASAATVAHVRENLLQLAVAAACYFQTSGRLDVAVADLAGPGRLIEAFRPAAGEDYSDLRFTRTSGPLSVVLADGSVVAVGPEAVVAAAARYHVARAGEEFADLARRAGQPLAAVLELNELAAPDELPRPGRLLRLR